MFLCQFCKSIEVQHLPSATGVTLRPDEFEAAPSQAHYPSFFSLQESSKTCKLCHLFFKSLKFEQSEQLPSGCAYISMGHTDWADQYPPLIVEPVNVRALSRSSWSVNQKQLYGIQVSCGYRTCELGLYADDDSRAKRTLTMVGEKPEPVKKCRRPLKWIQTCLESHDVCSRYQTLFASATSFPTRLLDLQPTTTNADVLLVDGSSCNHAPYVALSHCWGAAPVVRTVKANLLAFRTRIDPSSLNKTFNDAMDVTRRLGVRYLWIDSLCIVQDDADDWDREAARMAQVYSQAYVTIAATSAPDGTHGLIRKAPDELFIPLHFHNSDSLNRGVSIGPLLHKFQRIDREPLNGRAWTLQERLLSPRTLHYAADQVHWECRQSIISESGSSPYGYGQGESAENSAARGWLGKMARDIVPDIKPGNKEVSKSVGGDPKVAINDSNVSYDNWYRMLQNYTERNITKDADRLPALSGIARAFSIKKPSLYLAGVWLDDIASGLLWYVNVPESARRPDTYRAPSWSWAAVEGSPITFLSTHFFGRRPGEVDEIEYVGHDVDLDSTDPFGRVKAGSLTLRGYVKASMLKTVQEGQEIDGVRTSIQMLFDEKSAIGSANLDVAIADGPVHCLLATCTYPQDPSLHYTPNIILLLRSIGNAGQFQRVGMAALLQQRIREPQKHFDPIPQPGDPSFTQTGKAKLGEQTPKGESLETWFDDIETSVISIL